MLAISRREGRGWKEVVACNFIKKDFKVEIFPTLILHKTYYNRLSVNKLNLSIFNQMTKNITPMTG